MQSKSFIRDIMTFPLLVLGGMASSAYAQADPARPVDGPQKAGEETRVEDIVVTARKVKERLQDAPVTMTAFSKETVNKLQLKSIYDLAASTPSLYYGAQGGRNGGNKLQIRNLSTGTSGFSKASVFIDGVYMAADYSSTPLANLERIEVLKGPQSTAYGRSTFVGAVNFITKDPDLTEFKGSLDATIKQYGDRDVSGYLSVPIVPGKLSDVVSFRYYDFTGPSEWRNSDGYHLGDQTTRAISNKLLWTPTDNLNIRLYSSYVRDKDHIPPVLNADLLTRNLTVARPDGTFGYYWSGPVKINYTAPNWDERIVGFLNDPGFIRKQTRNVLSFDLKLGGHTLSGFLADGHEVHRNNFDFRYVGSGTIVLPNARNVLTPSPYGSLFNNNIYVSQETHDTQAEIRLAAPPSWRLRYLVGFNYTKLSGHYTIDYAGVGPTGVISPLTRGTDSDNWLNGNPARDLSVFGSLEFDATDKLTITGELRRQSELVSSTNYLTGAHFEKTFNSLLPRASLRYKFSPDFQIYASYSVGNNPGGFNSIPAAALPANVPQAFGEEKLKNYEFGVKGVFLDKRLQVEAAVYYMDWINQQVVAQYLISFPGLATSQTLTTASSSSKAYGFEFQVNAVPVTGFDLRATFAYGKATYVDFCSNNFALLTGVQDRPGCRLVNGKQQEGTPALQFSLAAGYTHAISDTWNLFTRADYQHASKIYLDEFNYAWAAPQNVVNLQVGVTNDRWTISAIVTNLTNEDVGPRMSRQNDTRPASLGSGYPAINGFSQSAAGSQGVTGTARKPRQFGIRVAMEI